MGKCTMKVQNRGNCEVTKQRHEKNGSVVKQSGIHEISRNPGKVNEVKQGKKKGRMGAECRGQKTGLEKPK